AFRRMKKRAGSASSREPTPYRTAATCLHMSAQTGQEQSNEICFGDGNNPLSFATNRSPSDWGNSPLSRSAREPSLPSQVVAIFFHTSLESAFIKIVIEYGFARLPCTSAVIFPASI